jgi:hypothetical protein
MRRRTIVPVALTLAATAAGAPLAAALIGGPPARVPKVATLTGAAERPGPGDRDGRGIATVLVPTPGTVCFSILVTGIDTPNAAHIHRGKPSKAGPVVVPLTAPSSGSAGAVADCVTAPPALTSEIARKPGRFYVNVHTAAFPDGAIRGQLRIQR